MLHVFMSYSHADEDLRDELEKHLAGLRRQGTITTWHDRRIGPGEDLHGQINAQLNTADIILLLVSADFLASDYCNDVEMTQAMERHEQHHARVIPVILRPCVWQDAPFGHLRAVPADGKPVVQHATLDEGLLEVAQAIREVASARSSQLTTASSSGPAIEGEGAIRQVPRSSNLRVRKEFTDREYHVFLQEAFGYIARYFENSLKELRERNEQVESDFRRMDANRFEARTYLGGEEKSLCGIWLGGLSRTDSLLFSYDGVGNGSHNESMSVGDDGYTLFLEPMGIPFLGQQQDKHLTMEGRCRVLLEPLHGETQIEPTCEVPFDGGRLRPDGPTDHDSSNSWFSNFSVRLFSVTVRTT